MEQQLGFRLLPSWEQDEWQTIPRPYNPALYWGGGVDLLGFPLSVRPDWGHLDVGGVRATSLISAGEAITWSDADNDGYDETGTIGPVATTVTDPCEVGVWYPGESAADDSWRIRPLTSVSIVAGMLTVTFRREQCVLPEFLEALYGTAGDHVRAVDGLVDANFLTEVDVYRVYNDPSTMATLLWRPSSGCTCLGSIPPCATCQYNTATACMSIAGDRRIGRWALQPATWNEDTLDFTTSLCLPYGRQPDMVRLNYRAGWRRQGATCVNLEMDQRWQMAVARYAAALLERDLCDCSVDMIRYWRHDMAVSSSDSAGGESRQLHDIDLANPFGTRRGMVMAWREVSARGVRRPVVAVSR